jgi:hypothetical protein
MAAEDSSHKNENVSIHFVEESYNRFAATLLQWAFLKVVSDRNDTSHKSLSINVLTRT